MSEAFSLTQSRCAAADSSLREELRSRTGSQEAASGILRCIERFGADPTIVRYEISPKSRNRPQRGSAPVAWSVRAVRADTRD
jgi:hypothetical protein